jgi:phosphoribosylglycinamide formyltransferase-1
LKNVKIAVFCYNFPHKKTQDILLRLFLDGVKVDCIFSAEPVKLNIPSSMIHTKIKHIAVIHPKKIADRLGIKYYVLPHNSIEVRELIKSNKLDLGIIAGARILKTYIINSFSVGIINFHPGLVPEARGLDAMPWSIYKRIPLGVTAHLIDSHIDAGRIIIKEKIPIYKNDTLLDLSERLYEKQIDILFPAIQKALKGKWAYVETKKSGYNRKMPQDIEKQVPNILFDYLKMFAENNKID